MSNPLLLLARGGGGVHLLRPTQSGGGTAQPVASLSVAPAAPTVIVGDAVQLTATPTDSSGHTLTGRLVTWESSDPSIATVSASGLVQSVAVGGATITATCEGKSASATLTVAAAPVAGTFVTFPDPRLDFLMGPLVTAGDGLMDGSSQTTDKVPWPYYDLNLSRDLAITGPNFPHHAPVYPSEMPGTVSLTNGSTQVVGVGTQFTKYIAPVGERPGICCLFIDNQAGAYYPLKATAAVQTVVASVEDDAHMTLANAWSHPTIAGSAFSTRVSGGTTLTSGKHPDSDDTGTNYYGYWNYYDQGLAQYIEFYRTGDPQYAANGRRIVNSYATHETCKNYTATPAETMAPREMAFSGFMIQGIRDDAAGTGAGPNGESIAWDWLEQITTEKLFEWLTRFWDVPIPHQGIRDTAFMVAWAAKLAYCLPDSYPCTMAHDGYQPGDTVTDGAARRDSLKATVARAATDYYKRLQYPDGSWRYRIEDDEIVGAYIDQTFQHGLVMEALFDTYRLLQDDPIYATAAEDARRCIVLGAQWPYRVSYDPTRPFDDPTGTAFRRGWYFCYGESCVSAKLSGTATLTPGSAAVVGSGTPFLSRLNTPERPVFFAVPRSGAVAISALQSKGSKGNKNDPASLIPLTNGATTLSVPGAGWAQAVGMTVHVLQSSDSVEVFRATAVSYASDSELTLSRPFDGADGNYIVTWDALQKVTGSGTAFLSDFKGGDWLGCVRADGTRYMGEVVHVESDAVLSIGSTGSVIASGMPVEWLSKRRLATGTVSTDGTTLTGTGTKFLSELAPYMAVWVRLADGSINPSEIRSVESDTSATVLQGVGTHDGAEILRVSDLIASVEDEEHLTLRTPWDGPATGEATVLLLASPGLSKPVQTSSFANINSYHSYRQNLDTCLAPMGQAALLSDPANHPDEPTKAQLLAWGDEMFSAFFGHGVGPGADAQWALTDSIAASAYRRTKELCQAHRTCGRYLAHRLGRLF